MRKKISAQPIIMVCLSAGLVLGSCKKFLTISPKSSFDENYVFSSVGSATSAVMGVYAHMAGDNGYGFNFSLVYQVDSDDCVGSTNSSPGGGDNGPKAIARYNATPSNTYLISPFNNMFGGIEAANICIKDIPKMSLYTNGSASEKAALQRLYGEVLTLRAQFYFELIRNWGDVPAQFIPSADQTDLYQPKTDRNVIYAHILDDLRTAETLVPWKGDPGVALDERITKGAVKALRAKIALFRGGYSLRNKSGKVERDADYLTYYKIAKDELGSIMQSGKHALNPTFQGLFKDVIDAHRIDPLGEVMFEVASAGGVTYSDSRLGSFDGPNVGAAIGGGQVKILPTYFYAFDQADTRMAVTIADFTVNTSGYYIGSALNQMASGKFRRDWMSPAVPLSSTATFNGVNWPLIRYADVLLMFAEADNEINGAPSDSAVNAYEMVRKRAFGANSIGTTPRTKVDFFNAIVNERYFEFGGEGIRKYDLIRWNLIYPRILQTRADLTKLIAKQAPYDKLPPYRFYKTSSPSLVWFSGPYGPVPGGSTTGYVAINWTIGVTAAFAASVGEVFQPNHSELFPIPQAAINANPKLTQDFGY